MSCAAQSFRRLAVLVIVGLVCLSSAVGVVSAQEQRTGGSITVGPDETHDGDLEATAGTVLIAGSVDGELTATGGSVTVTGDVTGDVTATGGTVVVEGAVDGDLTATGGDVRIRDGATVGGAVEATGGTVTVEGSIDGATRLDGESVTVGPTATIGDDLTYSGDETAVSDEAEITGDVTETDRDAGPAPFSDVSLPDIPDAAVTPLVGVYLFLANFLLGAVALVVAPRFSEQVSGRGVDRPLVSAGVGVGTLLGLPVVIGALALSIVGIPLAFFAGYGSVFLLWAGLVYGAFVVGTWGLSVFGYSHRWGGLASGLVVVSVANALPYVRVSLIVLALFGIGAVIRALYGRRFATDDGRGPAPSPAVPNEP